MKAVAEEFAEAVPDAFAGDGVAFLQTVYKDRSCRYQSGWTRQRKQRGSSARCWLPPM